MAEYAASTPLEGRPAVNTPMSFVHYGLCSLEAPSPSFGSRRVLCRPDVRAPRIQPHRRPRPYSIHFRDPNALRQDNSRRPRLAPAASTNVPARGQTLVQRRILKTRAILALWRTLRLPLNQVAADLRRGRISVVVCAPRDHDGYSVFSARRPRDRFFAPNARNTTEF